MNSRDFDIVLYGATGFTGRLTAEHLARRSGADGALSWAIAGRNAQKLAGLREELGADQAAIVIADLGDPDSLRSMARRARVVGTAAGPYQLYGEPVAAACAEAGTDYLDLSAETAWIRHLIDRWAEPARKSGARLAPCAGFDSIPSELGVMLVQQEAKARFGRTLPYVKGRVLALRSGLSGGSAATAAATASASRQNPSIAALQRDPFALTPGFRGPPQPDARTTRYDPDVDSEVGPFMMAAVNTKSVHRLNLLLGHPWGADFRYDEMSVLRDGAPVDFDRSSIGQRKPGEGPSLEERESGFYLIRYIGLGPDGERIGVSVEGDADPGYGSTAKIFGEAIIGLAQDRGGRAGGVWTPGALMAADLLVRLQAHAGVTFTVEA